MATTDVVNSWDRRALAALEATFGTTPNAAAAQVIEAAEINMGPAEQGNTRPKKDKTAGRDETLAFVEGRIDPIPFSVTTPVKSRATAATAAKESALLQAGGLIETIGASVVYGVTSTPTIQGLSLYAHYGATGVFAEQGRGGLVKNLDFEFGDKELMLKAAGAFAAKYHLGSVDSATVADGSATSVVLAAGESYRFQVGWYQWASEIVYVSAVNTTTDTLTVARAQLGSTGAAHAGVALTPYIPSLSPSGAAISEANCVVTLDSVVTKCTKGSVQIETGMDHLPGMTSSAYRIGGKATRVKVKAALSLVLTRAQVDLIGKTKGRKAVALTVVCGTGAGSIVTFSLPTCELRPFVVPDTFDDIAVVDVPIAVRGGSGNDLITITYS